MYTVLSKRNELMRRKAVLLFSVGEGESFQCRAPGSGAAI